MPYVWMDSSDMLDELDTEDLESELKRRKKHEPAPGVEVYDPDVDPITGMTSAQLLDAIFENRRANKDERVLALMDRWLYLALGRIV